MTATAAQHDQVRVAEERRNRYARITAEAVLRGNAEGADRFAELYDAANVEYHAMLTGAGVIQ